MTHSLNWHFSDSLATIDALSMVTAFRYSVEGDSESGVFKVSVFDLHEEVPCRSEEFGSLHEAIFFCENYEWCIIVLGEGAE